MRTLYLAFIWNQHQPYYANTITNNFLLPWVRLHGFKDYYSMAKILKNYPGVKATFNLTPCLLEQLHLHQEGITDPYYMVMGDPTKLSYQQKLFLLKKFFNTNLKNKVFNHIRYEELFHKRNLALKEDLELFTTCDYVDLQTLFNLAWLDEEVIKEYPELEVLLRKKRGYTEADKKSLLKIQQKVLANIIPIHLELAKEKRVEIITSPYFHPILPLTASENIDDALWQLKAGLDQYTKLWGQRAKGLWLPELAIDEASINLLSQEKVKWTLADEDILAKTLGISFIRNDKGSLEKPDLLYRPYTFFQGDNKVTLLFRDHYLSDLIGFSYNKLSYYEAVENLIKHLEAIYLSLEGYQEDFIVTIALDGENPWNDYLGDKRDFVNYLYHRLSSLEHIKTTTPEEFIENHYKHNNSLEKIAPGSWVDASFSRWKGSPSKDRAWELLRETKAYLQSIDSDSPSANWLAQKSYYAAQGSDYPWWFDSMPFEYSKIFDQLFRLHLSNVYIATGKKPPKELACHIINPTELLPLIKEPKNDHKPLTMIAHKEIT